MRFWTTAGRTTGSDTASAARSRNSAAKIVGRETVQYVGNIYKYYVAYSMYAEQVRGRKESVGAEAEPAQ